MGVYYSRIIVSKKLSFINPKLKLKLIVRLIGFHKDPFFCVCMCVTCHYGKGRKEALSGVNDPHAGIALFLGFTGNKRGVSSDTSSSVICFLVAYVGHTFPSTRS